MLSDEQIDLALNNLDVAVCEILDEISELKYKQPKGPKMMDFVVDGKFIKPTCGTRKNKILEIVKKGQHLRQFRFELKQLQAGPMQSHCVEQEAINLLTSLGINYAWVQQPNGVQHDGS